MRPLAEFAAAAAVVTSLVTSVEAQVAPKLGPVDSASLPALDTGRVAIGTIAPDFALESMAGDTVRLSQFRGKKAVVLVFYRGHW